MIENVVSLLCAWCHRPVKSGEYVSYNAKRYHQPCFMQLRDVAMVTEGTL